MAEMSWEETCQIVAGAVIRGRLHPAAISNPDDLLDPYREYIKRKQKRDVTKEDALALLGASAFERATIAADRYKNTKVDFVAMLRKAVAKSELLGRLQKTIDLIERGEVGSLASLMAAYAAYEGNAALFERLDLIKPDPDLLVPCGYEPFDKEIGGLPKWGVTIIAGTTGTGKTHLARSIATGYAKLGIRTGIFSLEMSKGETAYRFVMANVPEKLKKFIYVSEKIVSPGEMAGVIAQMDSIDAFIIDYADLSLQGKISEETMSNFYLTMFAVGKELGKKIIVLAQFNRGYDGNMPRISLIKFSSAAEQLAKLIILAHNPAQVIALRSEDTVLPIIKGKAWLMVAKSRGGYGPNHTGPGAIQVDFNGKAGWGDKSYGWTPIGDVN